MKPINEKERTNAFIQFMALFSVTLILVAVYVLMNGSTYKKEREILRTENRQLKEEKSFNNNFSSSIDSIVRIVKSMDRMEESDYQSNLSNIRFQFDKWKNNIQNGDTSNSDRIKISVSNAINNWMTDKKLIIDYSQLRNGTAVLTKERDDAQKSAKEWKDKYDDCMREP